MLNIIKQRRSVTTSIITLVILVFVLNSIITSCRNENTSELDNTISITPSTSVNDTIQSSDIIQNKPEESKTQTTAVEIKNSTMTALPATSVNDAKQSGDATTNKPVKSETQKPTNDYSKEKDVVDNSQKITKIITFNYDGKDVELKVSYMEKDNNKVFLREPNKESFLIYYIEASDKAILEYKRDLFYVDVDRNIVTPLLNEDCGEYSKRSLIELAMKYKDGENEEYGLVWGRNPTISKDGTKMVFYTNRHGLLGDNDSSGTWLKDLITGEEKLLLNGDKEDIGLYKIGCYGNNCLGWDEYGFVYFSGFGNVIKVNPETEEISLITNDASTATLAGYYVVTCNRKEVKIFNTVEDTCQVIKPKADRICIIFSFTPDENYVIFSYYTQPGSFHTNLGIIDLYKNTVHYINIPEDIILDGLSCTDNNQLLINYYHLNSKDKAETLFIDLKDLIAKEYITFD